MQGVELLRGQEDGVQLAVHRGVLHRGRLPRPGRLRLPSLRIEGEVGRDLLPQGRRRADEEHPPIAVAEDVDPWGNRQGLARLVRQAGRAVVDGQRPPGQEPRAGGRGRRRSWDRRRDGHRAGGGGREGGVKPARWAGGGAVAERGGSSGARGAGRGAGTGGVFGAAAGAPAAVSGSWRPPAWPAGQAPPALALPAAPPSPGPRPGDPLTHPNRDGPPPVSSPPRRRSTASSTSATSRASPSAGCRRRGATPRAAATRVRLGRRASGTRRTARSPRSRTRFSNAGWPRRRACVLSSATAAPTSCPTSTASPSQARTSASTSAAGRRASGPAARAVGPVNAGRAKGSAASPWGTNWAK